MQEPMKSVEHDVEETKEQLIERLLAKAELDYKCCGGHCSSFVCTAGADSET